MSENTPENNNENLDQEEQQGQTQGEEQGQESETMELDEERMFGPEDENVPKEIKEKVEGLGMGKPNAYYQVSEEEYEKMKKHIPEDLQKTIASSKIKNGAAPQLWLPFFNTVALCASLIPGLGAIVGLTALYGNLKILPMLSAEKVENSVKNLPSYFRTDNNDKKQPSEPKEEDNGKQPFGSKYENNQKQPFGTAGTNPSPEPKTKEGNTVNFETADSNSVLDSLKKINQSFGTGKTSSSPAPHAEKLEELKQMVKKPPKVDTPPH